MAEDKTDISAITFMIIIQLSFFALLVIIGYSIVTFNINLLIFFTLCTFLQMPFTERNQTYINFIAPKAAKYFKIKRIYE